MIGMYCLYLFGSRILAAEEYFVLCKLCSLSSPSRLNWLRQLAIMWRCGPKIATKQWMENWPKLRLFFRPLESDLNFCALDKILCPLKVFQFLCQKYFFGKCKGSRYWDSKGLDIALLCCTRVYVQVHWKADCPVSWKWEESKRQKNCVFFREQS